MKKLNGRIFFLLIILAILTYSCSEDQPILSSSPIANAGADQLVEVFDTVYLQGIAEQISEGAEYIWTFDYKPDCSKAKFSDSSTSNPIFIPDKQGFYNVKLVLNSGEIQSEPDYVLIQSIFRKSEQYFPNSVGSKWVYETYSSLGEKDTLTFEIVGEILLQNNTLATIWVSNINTRIYFYSTFDTLYCSIISDTITFFNSWNNYTFPAITYSVPFNVGDTINNRGGIFIVDNLGQVSFGCNTANDAYTIKEYRGGPNLDLVLIHILSQI